MNDYCLTTHTHTHSYVYIYIYIYIEREREIEREKERERKRKKEAHSEILEASVNCFLRNKKDRNFAVRRVDCVPHFRCSFSLSALTFFSVEWKNFPLDIDIIFCRI